MRALTLLASGCLIVALTAPATAEVLQLNCTNTGGSSEAIRLRIDMNARTATWGDHAPVDAEISDATVRFNVAYGNQTLWEKDWFELRRDTGAMSFLRTASGDRPARGAFACVKAER